MDKPLTDADIKTVRHGTISATTAPDDHGRDDRPAPPTSDPPGHDHRPGGVDDRPQPDRPGHDHQPGSTDDARHPDDAGRDDA